MRTTLTDFVSIRTLEKIQDNFSEATGISCVIRNPEGKQITKFTKPSLLWQEITKHPKVEEELSIKLIEVFEKCSRTGQVKIYARYIDTYAFVVPIFIEGKITAFFIGGLVRFGNPNLKICSEEAQKFGLELDNFLEMYLALPLISEKKLLACGNLFKVIAITLSTLKKM